MRHLKENLKSKLKSPIDPAKRCSAKHQLEALVSLFNLTSLNDKSILETARAETWRKKISVSDRQEAFSKRQHPGPGPKLFGGFIF